MQSTQNRISIRIAGGSSIGLATALLLGLSIATPRAAEAASADDLGTFTTIDFPGAAATTPKGINAKGEIVGFYRDSAGALHGFLFANNQFSSVEYPGASFTQATGINSSDDISGLYGDAAGTHGFVLSAGQFSSLDLPGASITDIWAINGDGDLVGFAGDGKIFHGFVRTEGTELSAVDFPEAVSTLAFGINCQGRVVGQYSSSDGSTHGFLRSRTGAFTSFDMPGNINTAVGTEARGINSGGEIVGWFTDSDGRNRGFLRTRSGDFTTVDFPGSGGAQALQINDRGDIVGTYAGGHGFLLTRAGAVGAQ